MRGHGFSESTLVVDGLDELIRDLGQIDPAIKRNIQRELHRLADLVAWDAMMDIQRRNLVDSGDMLRGIRARVKNRSNAVVQSNAKHRGYRYPAVFEYGGRARSAKRNTIGAGRSVSNRSAIGAALASSGAARGMFGEYGPQAILQPALIKNENEIMVGMESMLDRTLRDHSF